MIKRFFKWKPYSLMLAKQDENGDPFTWRVNVIFKEHVNGNLFLKEPNIHIWFIRIILCTTQMVTQTIVATVQILYMDGSFKWR